MRLSGTRSCKRGWQTLGVPRDLGLLLDMATTGELLQGDRALGEVEVCTGRTGGTLLFCSDTHRGAGEDS